MRYALTRSLVLSAAVLAILASPSLAQETRQLKQPQPSRTMPGVKDLASAKHVDLTGAPYYPAGISGMPGTLFCMPPSPGLLGNSLPQGVRFIAKNNGTAQAGPYTILFDFGSVQKTVQRPVHAPGMNIIIDSAIPAAAWSNGSINFTITVDAKNKVNESNEGNNTLQGTCLAPAT